MRLQGLVGLPDRLLVILLIAQLWWSVSQSVSLVLTKLRVRYKIEKNANADMPAAIRYRSPITYHPGPTHGW